MSDEPNNTDVNITDLAELIERFLTPNMMQVLAQKAYDIGGESFCNRVSFSIDYSFGGGKATDPYISRVAVEQSSHELNREKRLVNGTLKILIMYNLSVGTKRREKLLCQMVEFCLQKNIMRNFARFLDGRRKRMSKIDQFGNE